MPPWLTALLLTSFIQMAGSFMSQCMPVIAPLLTEAIHVPKERIGVLTALVSFGSVVFLALGTPLVVRFGPVRAIQASVICGAASLSLVHFGQWEVVAAAACLLGLSYGPVPPGTTRILGATAPAKHRGLIFSTKQAAAQAGGVLAGVILAPIAAAYGWHAALATSAGVGFLAGLTAFLARSPEGQLSGLGRDPSRALFKAENLRAPFAVIAADPQLIALTVLTTAFAVAQGCLFSFCVTFLNVSHGAGLVAAGGAYAFMQGGAAAGRLVLGFMADRSGNTMRNLLGQALGCSVFILLWANLPLPVGAWWVGGLAFIMGALAASWNGLVLSEIARLAAPAQVADAAAGSTMISFLGYVFGPALFSAAVRGFGEWHTPYAIVATQLALTALALPVWLRRRARASLLAANASNGRTASEDARP